ncbi:MAG: hypothetical protein A3F18_01485 [Legionellales bacterium RIFCSPHIGHO2_12_FULL_37_14]|nr:MAG: hypothetical protein A3F18_01485 [Legionellales bacterium RIFCSPHIGHO2_12_FULL_37_14]
MQPIFKFMQIAFLMSFFYSYCFAEANVDLFGDDSAKGEEVLREYATHLAKLVDKKWKMEEKYQFNLPEKVQAKLQKERAKMCSLIKNKGNYLYVDFETVYYPDENTHYTTIEVIKKEEKHRLKWLKDQEAEPKPQLEKNDLITAMQNYIKKGMELMLNHELDVNSIQCTGYHCLFGFENPQLKPYKEQFSQGVITDKFLIIQTLAQDKDKARRAASVFLVGEFTNPHEILATLLPYVKDKDEEVRNNAMRVIANTMHKSGYKKVDIMPFIELLDSPYESDRNKALFVLLEAASLTKQNLAIRLLAEDKLKQLAKLTQPNNKLFAQQILAKLTKQ